MRKTNILAVLFLLSIGESFAQYNTSHESIASYDVPTWYSQGKLGIFMHLSAFSVPAFKNEWYPHNMYYDPTTPNTEYNEYRNSFREYHEQTYGPLDAFGYKDFIPMFTLDNFDADYYADLVKKSGATYFAAPAVHHDGFAMWDSNEIQWNAKQMGPERDVVGELTIAMREKGIKTGVSTHYGRHWKYYTFRPEFDTWDPAFEGIYGKRREDNDPPLPEDALQWERVMNELIDGYQPDYIFVDGGVCDAHGEYQKEYFREAMYRVVSRYYNKSVDWNKEVVLSWKRDIMQKGEAVYDTEGSLEKDIPTRPWQAHFTINGKWGYAGERPATSMEPILRCFIDVVSRNGNVLLNIGLRPDGSLDANQEEVLLELGDWLEINGEGINGSEPWEIWGEGKLNSIAGGQNINDFETNAIRYTQKGGFLYAWFVTWPDDGKVVLPMASGFNAKSIIPLGGTGTLEFSEEGDDLVVNLPENQFGKYVWGLKLSKEFVVNVLNGDFEDGLNNWLTSNNPVNSDDAYEGSSAVRIYNKGAVNQWVTVEANTDYEVSGFFKTSNTAKRVVFGVYDSNDALIKSSSIYDAAYTGHTLSFNSGSSTSVKIFVWQPPSDNAYAYADGIQIMEADIMGVSKHIEVEKVKIYPNPVIGNATISVPGVSSGIVEIYSILGQKVLKVLLTDNSAALNTQNLQPGLYIAKLIVGNQKIFKRFVIAN